jgi:uncharacterized protein YoxC
MDAMTIVILLAIVAAIVLIVALVLLVLRLGKMLDVATKTIASLQDDVKPTMANVKIMTDDIVPVVKKVEPIVDRVQLTLDAVNLEMMRVDEILEDVTQITDSAASATTAVDTIASAPVKAVSGMATKVRERFGTKDASDASAQIGEQRAAVERALEEYKAAEAEEAEEVAKVTEVETVEEAGEAPQAQVQFDRVIQELDAATKEAVPEQ